jgi:hypothetical protein
MTRALILSVFVAALAAGCASAPKPSDSTTANVVDKAPLANVQCVQDTGSYIKRKDEKCQPVAGRSYSNDDLTTTGELNTVDALKKLDPSFH